ncbi:MAG TPA: TonB family protein [Rhodanobacteraceae bacterium]
MATIPAELHGPPENHFGAALLFSLLLHAVLILGIGFHFAKPAPRVPTLDVTLVNTANDEAPAKADYLAQVDNAGGGNSARAHRPGAPLSGPLPIVQAGITPRPLAPATARPQTATGPQVIGTTATAKNQVAAERHAQTAPQPAARTAAIAVQQRLEMARLAQQVRAEREAYARRPRKRYISANTRSVADAAYQVAWVRRIERIGNLNYPDAARRRHLFGNVVLSVTLGRDGHVRGVTVNVSSGHPVLDDAAVRIVHLAAPLPPIPHDKDAAGNPITELVITRTWQFLPGGHLATRAVPVRP